MYGDYSNAGGKMRNASGAWLHAGCLWRALCNDGEDRRRCPFCRHVPVQPERPDLEPSEIARITVSGRAPIILPAGAESDESESDDQDIFPANAFDYPPGPLPKEPCGRRHHGRHTKANWMVKTFPDL